MSIFLYIFKFHLIIIYFFIKLFTIQKKQVFFLSRQFDDISINYKLLMRALDKKNIDYKYICKKVDSGINDSIRTYGNHSNIKMFFKKLFSNIKSALKYYFSLYKQMYLIAKSKVIIVDGYNLPVSMLKHKKGTKVIQMWHALGAIKKFGYQAIGKKDGVPVKFSKILKMHANYDYILSGSEAMNDYFAEAFNTPIENILAIGTPIVDYIKTLDNKIANRIKKEYPLLNEKKNVLYSPTFRNDKSNNNKEFFDKFDFKKYNLIITNHPKVEDDDYDERVTYISKDKFSVFDVLTVSDFVITDYSALMIDAAIANKKILLYVYDFEKYSVDNGVNINLLKEWPTIAFKKAEDVVANLDEKKYDTKEYSRFKNTYTPKVKNSTNAIVKIIEKHL